MKQNFQYATIRLHVLRIPRFKKGVTLIELLVTTALISVLTMIIGNMLNSGLKNYRVSKHTIDLQEKAAAVMREFEYSTRAASQFVTAKPNELIFYRYYSLDAVYPTRVRYFVEGNVFKVGKIEPVGTPPNVAYPEENEVIDLLVTDVVNYDHLFTYYDDSGGELTDPVAPSAARLVQLDIALDNDSGNSPVPISESTRVNLRNMKKNL